MDFADTVPHAALMLPHPDWTVAFDANEPQAAASRRALLERAAAERTRLFSYHLPFPGLGARPRGRPGRVPVGPRAVVASTGPRGVAESAVIRTRIIL